MPYLSRGLIALVRLYQWTLRPLLGGQCRFAPACSDYAVEALRAHGPFGGAWLAGARILRCNPWHPGGHDPVPPRTCLHPACAPGASHTTNRAS